MVVIACLLVGLAGCADPVVFEAVRDTVGLQEATLGMWSTELFYDGAHYFGVTPLSQQTYWIRSTIEGVITDCGVNGNICNIADVPMTGVEWHMLPETVKAGMVNFVLTVIDNAQYVNAWLMIIPVGEFDIFDVIAPREKT